VNNGLTGFETGEFLDLLRKANMVQLIAMKNHIDCEHDRRIGFFKDDEEGE